MYIDLAIPIYSKKFSNIVCTLKVQNLEATDLIILIVTFLIYHYWSMTITKGRMYKMYVRDIYTRYIYKMYERFEEV